MPMNLEVLLECIGALLLLGLVLWRIDRWCMPRRHHDHLIPGTPRSPRRTR